MVPIDDRMTKICRQKKECQGAINLGKRLVDSPSSTKAKQD